MIICISNKSRLIVMLTLLPWNHVWESLAQFLHRNSQSEFEKHFFFQLYISVYIFIGISIGKKRKVNWALTASNLVKIYYCTYIFYLKISLLLNLFQKLHIVIKGQNAVFYSLLETSKYFKTSICKTILVQNSLEETGFQWGNKIKNS